jgi:hypothetical protein
MAATVSVHFVILSNSQITSDMLQLHDLSAVSLLDVGRSHARQNRHLDQSARLPHAAYPTYVLQVRSWRASAGHSRPVQGQHQQRRPIVAEVAGEAG